MAIDNDIPVDVNTGEMKEGENVSVSPVWFDPVKDLHAVDPYGFINLHDAYLNNNVPTQVADEIASYNGIDDPESIVGTPHDVFEAYRMNDRIQNIDRVVSSSKEDKTS